jgi:opacity protein-like surface antigen
LTRLDFNPFLLLGAGASINRFSAYSESAMGLNSPTHLPFSAKTKNNFAYEVGLGISHALLPGAATPQLTLDCRYMNFGDAMLGPFDGQTASTGLSFGKLSLVSINVGFVF